MRKDGASSAALAALLLHLSHSRARPWRRGRSLATTFALPMRIEIDRASYEVEISREREGGILVSSEGHEQRFEIEELAGNTIRLRADGVTERVTFHRDGDRVYFQHRGFANTARDLTLAAPEAVATNGGDGRVRAAMNGRVVALLIKLGDRVEAGRPVLTLEAMKMEHVHVAGIAGNVAAIDVTEGQQVSTGQILVEIESSRADE
jgi:geranyl-CoA carboxylase alpha subunit